MSLKNIWICILSNFITAYLDLLLGQQCWELLRPCWQWCANGCNNSQQCWPITRSYCVAVSKEIVCNERAWPQQCWKSCTNGSNIVALRFGDHGTKEMFGAVGLKVCRFQTLRNNYQQHATTCNRLYKRTQHVTSNNVATVFAGALGLRRCAVSRGATRKTTVTGDVIYKGRSRSLKIYGG